jgi:iron complex transport system permease protein
MTLFSTAFGAANISIKETATILMKQIPGLKQLVINISIPDQKTIIILSVRLPRVILAALVGASLAAAGVAFQGMFRNVMADPYIIGVSSGAAFGATLAIWLGLSFSFFGISSIGACAFIGATLTTITVYRIAQTGRTASVTTLLLAGIAISSFLSAAVSLVMLLDHENVSRIVFWTLGGLANARWNHVTTVLPGMTIGLFGLMIYARDLNIMAMGEDEAAYLGINVESVKRILLVVCSLLAGFAVAVSGIIGFVGLIVPHIARLIFGPDHQKLIPLSAVMGAIFLMLADIIARTIIAPVEIPVGVITAMFGGPFFIFLLTKHKRIV